MGKTLVLTLDGAGSSERDDWELDSSSSWSLSSSSSSSSSSVELNISNTSCLCSFLDDPEGVRADLNGLLEEETGEELLLSLLLNCVFLFGSCELFEVVICLRFLPLNLVLEEEACLLYGVEEEEEEEED